MLDDNKRTEKEDCDEKLKEIEITIVVFQSSGGGQSEENMNSKKTLKIGLRDEKDAKDREISVVNILLCSGHYFVGSSRASRATTQFFVINMLSFVTL